MSVYSIRSESTWPGSGNLHSRKQEGRLFVNSIKYIRLQYRQRHAVGDVQHLHCELLLGRCWDNHLMGVLCAGQQPLGLMVAENQCEDHSIFIVKVGCIMQWRSLIWRNERPYRILDPNEGEQRHRECVNVPFAVQVQIEWDNNDVHCFPYWKNEYLKEGNTASFHWSHIHIFCSLEISSATQIGEDLGICRTEADSNYSKWMDFTEWMITKVKRIIMESNINLIVVTRLSDKAWPLSITLGLIQSKCLFKLINSIPLKIWARIVWTILINFTNRTHNHFQSLSLFLSKYISECDT